MTFNTDGSLSAPVPTPAEAPAPAQAAARAPANPPAPLANKALTEEDIQSQKALEGVLSESYSLYCPENVKPLIDKLSPSGKTEWVEYHLPEDATGFFYVVASSDGKTGATKVRESRTRTTAHLNVSVPMRCNGVSRPADGRKERYLMEWDDNSPYGPALRVYTKARSNEPVEIRKKRSGQAKPAEEVSPKAPGAGGEVTGT